MTQPETIGYVVIGLAAIVSLFSAMLPIAKHLSNTAKALVTVQIQQNEMDKRFTKVESSQEDFREDLHNHDLRITVVEERTGIKK